jgi:hypothetical protein
MWGCKKDDGSYDEDCLSAPVFNLAVERIRAKLKDQRGIEVDRKHVIFTTDDPNPEYLWVSIWAVTWSVRPTADILHPQIDADTSRLVDD